MKNAEGFTDPKFKSGLLTFRFSSAPLAGRPPKILARPFVLETVSRSHTQNSVLKIHFWVFGSWALLKSLPNCRRINVYL
jgi:hypothetical protein